ncbi:MAG: hypothetical protein H0X30_37495 [Anaerolineae bacterium]|nr:hypothetical protein [Anaerolineae bacterium]
MLYNDHQSLNKLNDNQITSTRPTTHHQPTFNNIHWQHFGGFLSYIRHAQMAKSAAADTREPTAALAATAEPSAVQKCQFGGSLPHIRLPFRRELCKICNKIAFCALSLIANRCL